ncbi:MAG: hypothetical protein PHQ90_05760 [Sulfuricurvum sp.]|uniref:ATP-grasp domain-containing protein n=1 Tax=Sulfuricurvum sp. TaxID=2025608 RepID=UPI0026242F46|nr:hypothetical protein [Sulfuricurvum sp.]MDD2368790.1 hypothetical protein [Sulfuricurvum sp.]MDD2949314.1 hypothetical protein [Sulfuricurvum sp.]MDD5119082.1 hypothetical protein [Sulfuricurvum sp.]
MIRLLNFVGIDDSDTVVVSYNDGFLKSCRYTVEGNNSFLEGISPKNIDILTFHIGGIEQKGNISLSGRPDVIFNSICNPESNTKSLALLIDWLKENDVPLINHPEQILLTKRDLIYKSLVDIPDIVMPKTLRLNPSSLAEIKKVLEEEHFSYPILFRPANEHGGSGLIRIDRYEELGLLERYAFDGRDYFITEFVDFVSEDGLYRKSRYFVIDGKVYPRHRIVSTQWKIHAETRSELMNESTLFQNEEKKFLSRLDPEIEKKCLNIAQRVNLDCFGIDCHHETSGKMTIFEVNACMRPYAAHAQNYLNKATSSIKQAIEAMVIKRSTNG